jgi:hypothetical protein
MPRLCLEEYLRPDEATSAPVPSRASASRAASSPDGRDGEVGGEREPTRTDSLSLDSTKDPARGDGAGRPAPRGIRRDVARRSPYEVRAGLLTRANGRRYPPRSRVPRGRRPPVAASSSVLRPCGDRGEVGREREPTRTDSLSLDSTKNPAERIGDGAARRRAPAGSDET